eukprot:14880904-Heterocapsa_arctica.AAC.1
MKCFAQERSPDMVARTTRHSFQWLHQHLVAPTAMPESTTEDDAHGSDPEAALRWWAPDLPQKVVPITGRSLSSRIHFIAPEIAFRRAQYDRAAVRDHHGSPRTQRGHCVVTGQGLNSALALSRVICFAC